MRAVVLTLLLLAAVMFLVPELRSPLVFVIGGAILVGLLTKAAS